MAANRQQVTRVSLDNAQVVELLRQGISPALIAFAGEVAQQMNTTAPLNRGRWIVKTNRRGKRLVVSIASSKSHTRFMNRRERAAAKAFIKSKTVRRSIRLRRLPNHGGYEPMNQGAGIQWAA